MILYKNLKGKRITEASGFVSGYAYDPDHPNSTGNIFLMLNVLTENALLGEQFKLQYGNLYKGTYVKNIDFKPYNIYVFKRDLDVINEILAMGDIKYELPLEDDDSLYLQDDYSFTVKR